MATICAIGLKDCETEATPQARQQILRNAELLSLQSRDIVEMVEGRWGVIEESDQGDGSGEHQED